MFYICADGDNSSSGTIDAPWKTLSKLNAVKLEAHDTILLKRGSIWREELRIPRSGDKKGSFTIMAYGDGPLPVVSGADLASGFCAGDNLLKNGSFEEWETKEAPASWACALNGGAVIYRAKDRRYCGAFSSKIELTSNLEAKVKLHQKITSPLKENKKYRFSAHTSSLSGDCRLSFVVSRKDGGSRKYINPASGAWEAEPNKDAAFTPKENWSCVSFTFNTGPGRGDDYIVEIITTGKAKGNATCNIDALRLGLADIKTQNEISNPSFEYLDSTGCVKDWKIVADNNGSVSMTKNHRFGGVGTKIASAGDYNSLAISQAITLKGSTSYRISFECQNIETASSYLGRAALQIFLPKMGIYIKSDGNHSIDPVDALSTHQPEWSRVTFDSFETPPEDGQYIITLHPQPGAQFALEEPIYIDMVTCVKNCRSEEVYQAYFPEEPAQVYVNGKVNNKIEDHLQLVCETESLAKDMKNHPHLLGYSYDEKEKTLFINIGQDPGACKVECSVRERTINFDNSSFVTVQEIKATKAAKYGIDLSCNPDKEGVRPRRLSLKKCCSEYSGVCGVKAGHRPEDQVEGGLYNKEMGLTPAEILIEDCKVYKYNREGRIRMSYDPNLHKPDKWHTWFKSQRCGIVIFGDAGEAQVPTEKGLNIGNVTIRGCKVESDLAPLNLSCGRNGISVQSAGNLVIEDCEVVGAEHGIVTMGLLGRGSVVDFTIRRNYVHHTADDSIWIWGNTVPGNSVCYNILTDNPDNGVDLNGSSFVQVYGNTIYNTKNESIIIWGRDTACAFIFNNIILDYTMDFIKGPARKRVGAAIGLGYGVNPAMSLIDYNIYFNAKDTTLLPFHMQVGQKKYKRMSFDEWRALGFDSFSAFKDPHLTNPAGAIFTLQPGSLCAGNGADLSKIRRKATYQGNDIFFENEKVDKASLSPDSKWPGKIKTKQQIIKWSIGAYSGSDI